MTFVDKFELDSSQLGAGGYGVVVMATDTQTGEKVAAKMIDKRKMKASAIEREVLLMQLLDHPNIIALRGQVDMERNMFIFMELADKGELFGRVIQNGMLTEEEARPYFRQLMTAVHFMHTKGVAHRDLKLENVLLASGPEAEVCKVIDFGLAHRYEVDGVGKVLKQKALMETCGSKSYAAPEVLAGRGYDGFDADVWSCGICLFAMLAGFFPLDEATGADWRFDRVKLAIQNGLKDEDVLESAWTIDDKIVGGGEDDFLYDEAPRYRGGRPGDFLGDGGDAMMAPLYRGVQGAAPPMLGKQNAMFCADFHIEFTGD